MELFVLRKCSNFLLISPWQELRM